MNREIRIDSESREEAVTLEEVKRWAKIDTDADDSLITSMIKAVRQLQEQWTMRSFIGKTITVNWREADWSLDLPMGPVRSITSIKRVYEDGTLSDSLVSGTDYYTEGMDFQTVKLYKRWQSAGKIVTGLRIQMVVGHGSEAGQVPLPDPIRDALKRHVATDYEQRDDLEVYQPVLYNWVQTALAPYRLETWL